MREKERERVRECERVRDKELLVHYIRKRKKRERDERRGERYIMEREKSEGRCKRGVKEFACATYLSIYYIDIT